MGISDPPKPTAFQALVATLVRGLFFHRVTILGAEALPATGPVVYLGLHRNGATDGFVYQAVAPRAVPVVSRQLTRGLLGRLLFKGIGVARSKDVERYGMSAGGNQGALEQCAALLGAGGELVVLPEGTSDLGPSHLPFHPGAARIIALAHKAGIRPLIVPLGIHYERGWAFRTRVTVVVGKPFIPQGREGQSEAATIEHLQSLIEPALVSVGINVADGATQIRLEKTGYVAAMDSPTAYFSALKAFEGGLPGPVSDAWAALDAYGREHRLATHHGVPVAPARPGLAAVLGAIVTAPVVAAAAAANLPPLLAGGLAARVLADDSNVVTFWRILAGTPTALLYWAGVAAWLAATGRWPWMGGFVAVTWMGLALWRPAWQMAAMTANTLFRPGLVPLFRQLRATVREALGHG